jgi:MFS family permease
MLGVYTIVKVDDYGWGSAHTLGFGPAALVLLGGFLLREGKTANPLSPLGIFQSRTVSGANLVQFLLIAGMFGFQFLGVLYLQRVLGYSAIQTGLAMVPVAAAIGAISLGVSARLNTRFGERSVLLAGLMLIVAGLALLGRAPVGGDYIVDVLPAMLLLGVGFGMAMPALMALCMTGATESDSGVVSGLFNTTQQVGGALGLSVLAVVATTRTDELLTDGAGTASALTGGYHLAFNVAAGVVLAAAVLAATALRPRPSTAQPETSVGHEPSGATVPCS